MANAGPQSILIVEVPEAEPALARYRERFVASARLGVPAHVTVLFPFMTPQAIGPVVLAELEHLFAAVSHFHFQLTHTNWFGDQVLWLGVRDPEPFRALSRCVAETFPDFPPYGGQFGKAESHPHLTVGKTAEAVCQSLDQGKGHPVSELRSAEASVQPHLPIAGEATSVTLMTQESSGGQWTRAATFALA